MDETIAMWAVPHLCNSVLW